MSVNVNVSCYEYLWLDDDMQFRSKTRVIPHHNFINGGLGYKSFNSPYYNQYNIEPTNKRFWNNPSQIPKWNFDGSSTGQIKCNGTREDTTKNTELVLNPVFICPNPFNTDTDVTSYIVLCDVYNVDGTPHSSNTRVKANELFNLYASEKPWFGIEQEYFVCENTIDNTRRKYVDKRPMVPRDYDSKTTLAMPIYYCSQGENYGRAIAEEHMKLCIKAGLVISGINAEVVPSQWEYQIGPALGIEAADMLLVSRYLLERVASKHGCVIEYHPKPLVAWNGSGCHVNFSTASMRDISVATKYGKKNGLECIYEAIEKLKEKHDEHMAIYGKDNHMRLVGECEAPSATEFSWGVGTRHTSIRIGKDTFDNQCGYFEDRRPASNMDPYLVTSAICETVCNKN